MWLFEGCFGISIFSQNMNVMKALGVFWNQILQWFSNFLARGTPKKYIKLKI
jgi:hypothetical protein